MFEINKFSYKLYLHWGRGKLWPLCVNFIKQLLIVSGKRWWRQRSDLCTSLKSLNMILKTKTQFSCKNYTEKLSSTLLSNIIKWIRHIKFSRVRPTKYRFFRFFALLIIILFFKALFSMWPNSSSNWQSLCSGTNKLVSSANLINVINVFC